MRDKTTSVSLLHAREVRGGAAPLKCEENLAREVEDVETVAKCDSGRPPDHPCMRGKSAGREREVRILTCFQC